MPPEPIANGSTCEVHVYSSVEEDGAASNCLAFLSNWNQQTDCIVEINEAGVFIDSAVVAPWSVTIMKGTDCQSMEAIYNTKASVTNAQPENKLTGIPSMKSPHSHICQGREIPSINVPIVTAPSPLEQLSSDQRHH